MHLANTYKDNDEIVEAMIKKSYVRDNTLSLIFTIHHAQATEILEDILLHTICLIDVYKPATLGVEETNIFKELMVNIPSRIQSSRSVEGARKEERNHHDSNESIEDLGIKEAEDEFANEIYKAEKNIEILSQILKNKIGSLDKRKIEEIVETICDAGLRLVSLLLCNESLIDELSKYVEKKYEKISGFSSEKRESEQIKDLSKIVHYLVFVWTMTHIEKIVSAICKPRTTRDH